MTTLLVEDNPLDVRMVRYAIERENWETNLVVTDDGEKAFRYLLSEEPYQGALRPDFVILDLNLPKRSGAEVLSLMRNHAELSHLPVAVLSSSPEDVIRELVSSFHLTADLFLTKPISLDEYLAIGSRLRQCYEDRIRPGHMLANSGVPPA